MTNRLANIKNFDQLIRYLEDELDWPCQEYGFDEITFKYTAEELGIKDEDSVQIKQIHQLRPFYQGQPWGIFFIEFEKKHLPVALLRRVLSHLVVKKRASANSADKAVWNMDNLLFISAFGNESNDTREIAFAHFHQEDGDLPTLKVLGWDGADTVLKMEFVDQELHEKLHWPKDPKNVEAWQSTWSSAFRHKPGFVIKTANALADRLAELARGIRGAAETLMAHESEKGPLRQLYKAFQTALIHDLTEADFADTYAQTITYGLLTAAISRTDMSGGIYGTALVASNVTDLVPITNPFLKEMLETFIHAGDHKGGIQFDELGIQDVVDLLRGEETDLPAVLRDFDNKTPGEDPVIQFYEHFLSAYNKKLKIQRGVFYTPQPVVSYIVRSAHELLQTEFRLEDGLADTTTWGEIEKRIPGLKRPESTDPNSPFVMVLDPATGTATFLVEVIDVVFKTLTEKWEKQHLNKTAQVEAWNEYVPKHLLPRIFGFELMMAPYAIAHMKVGLKLFETGYRFGSTERVRIFLTNSLEPASDIKLQQTFEEMAPALAHEAKAVNEVKRAINFTVVIGNPPYSGHSANPSKDAKGALNFIGKLLHEYYFVDGVPLGEKNPKWLQDDYAKFICFGEFSVNKTGPGILAFITNHGYLDNPTFRGMRQHLMNTFDEIYLLDLHGNSKKKEIAPDGSKDENVFDIQQGVVIVLGIKELSDNPIGSKKKTFHSELWGRREHKYTSLQRSGLTDIKWKSFIPNSPNYLFIPQNNDLLPEYMNSWEINKIFPSYASTVTTARNDFSMSYDVSTLSNRISDLKNTKIDDSTIRNKYGLKDVSYWKLSEARKGIRQIEDINSFIKPYCYRPFDFRYVYYHDAVCERLRPEIMQHMIYENLAFLTHRPQSPKEFTFAYCTNLIGDQCVAANKTEGGGNSFQFPLYLYNLPNTKKTLFSQSEPNRQPNLALAFVKEFSAKLGYQFISDGQGDLKTAYGPEDVFNYAYAVFHSPTYRSRYAEFLKIDFPRLPLTGNKRLFVILVAKGKELVELHLLKSAKVEDFITTYLVAGENLVEKVAYSEEKVWINANQFFGKIPEELWNFKIGGYQVCEKWLKDRRGRQLSEEDITHYQKIIVALKETIRIMGEIDQVIEDHGGWPIK